MPITYHLFPSKAAAAAALGVKLADTILENPERRVGLATGSTMILVYAAALAKLQARGADLRKHETFNLDEWGFKGQKRLSRRDVRTFAGFMDKHYLRTLTGMGFDIHNAHFPSELIGQDELLEPGVDLAAYDQMIAQKGGIHTWLVGVGAGTDENPHDGHIAFIERTHLLHLGANWKMQKSYTALLEPDTIENNKGYEGCDGDPSKVPDLAITVGPATLIENVTDEVLMGAFGRSKAGTIWGACEGPMHAGCSASLVQELSNRGKHVHVYLDHDSSSLLTERNRFVVY